MNLQQIVSIQNEIMWKYRMEKPPLEVIDSTKRIELIEPCPICMRVKFRVAVTTNCGHVFCVTCIHKYYNKNKADRFGFIKCVNCPICRAPLKQFTRNPLLLVKPSPSPRPGPGVIKDNENQGETQGGEEKDGERS